MYREPAKVKFDWPFKENWAKDYHYYCEDAKYREGGKTVILFMGTIMCLTLLTLADRIGRKRVINIGVFCVIFGMVCNIFLPNLFMKIIMMGLSSGVEGVFSAMLTIMINENTSNLLTLTEISRQHAAKEYVDHWLLSRIRIRDDLHKRANPQIQQPRIPKHFQRHPGLLLRNPITILFPRKSKIFDEKRRVQQDG